LIPTRNIHTHCQVAQPNASTQAWQRVCLPNRTLKLTVNVANRKEQRRHNSTYPKGRVSCSKDSFVVYGSLVFQIKLCGISPALGIAAKRYAQCYEATAKQ